MMTNEELKLKIESLRIAEKQSFIYGDLIREAADIIENLSKDPERAADAIEELSAINQRQLLEIAVLNKPKWIPVTEQLPEEYKDVLCYYEYFRYGDYSCMFRTIDRGYYGDGRWGGEAGQGHKNKVLAWMPLPESPKEETE